MLFAPPLASIALHFTSADYFALITLGLVASIALSSGSILTALGMLVVGLLLGLAGRDIYTGAARFTYGQIELGEGLNFVALAMGMFGLAEVMRNLETYRSGVATTITKVSRLTLGREEIKRIVAPILRGTALGAVLGILPGGGGILASFSSYALERRIAKRPEEFGNGAIEGVAGPESANNAAAQTSFIPMLTLGIPSNSTMALMVGALMIQGITPGPNVAIQRPDLFWGVIVSMWIGNLMLVILNLPLVGIWVKFLSIPYRFLFPAIVALCCIGVFSINLSVLDIYLMAGFALIGYLLVKIDCDPAPLLFGFLLGPLLEEHFRRAMLYSRGDPIALVSSPIAGGLMLLSLIVLALTLLPNIARRRSDVFVEED